MKINVKKFLATASAVVMFMSAGAPAFAASAGSAEVADDGNATTSIFDTHNFRIDNTSSASQLNADLGIGVSGLNTQNSNDDDVTMGTGMADGAAVSHNFLNSNVSEIGTEAASGNSEAHSTVGDDGNATAYAEETTNVSVDNTSSARLTNLTLGLAISGLNNQNGNDDGTMLNTGSSRATANTTNEVNSNWTSIGGVGMLDGSLAEAHVADDGNSTSTSYDTHNTGVVNNNTASVNNITVAAAVSGGNSQSGNDDNNGLTSGASVADSNVHNFVNSNVTMVGGNTGTDSHATSTVGGDGNATSTSASVSNMSVENNNSAEVTNVSVGAGVSGGNTQNGNDDGNNMTTGEAHGSSTSCNTINSNWSALAGATLPEGSGSVCQ